MTDNPTWEYLRTSPPTFPERKPAPKEPVERRFLWFRWTAKPEYTLTDALMAHYAIQPTSEDIRAWMNGLGADGWEFVEQKGERYTFKRRT